MNLPQVFIQNIHAILGNESEAFLAALGKSSPVSIRTNTVKEVSLAHLPLSEKLAWCERGFYLTERPIFTLDPFLHAGCYYVQEASSMFLAEIAQQLFGVEHKPITALDLCAAPGGKTTLLADYLPKDSLLVANEAIRSRSHILVENVSKWGNPNLIVSNNDPKDFTHLSSVFDAVFVDAPCSGEGMFRKNANAHKEWSPANVQLCAERQRRILAQAWELLKPNGYLVYSTCTFNTKENEENVQWMIDEWGAESIAIQLDKSWGITSSTSLGAFASVGINAYRFFPHKVNGEGFFVAILQKKDGRISQLKVSKNKKLERVDKKLLGEVRNYIKQPELFEFLQENSHIAAIPQQHIEAYYLFCKHLHILQAGVRVAELKGKDILPHHNLAISCTLNSDGFMCIDLSLPQALAFLRRESIKLDCSKKGFYLLRYQLHPIGFIKHIGTRHNNLYPNEWRIRMR
ncbi:MAG: methyltransferase RsmF C-terminal domain-like protein [Bacteroidales bacterium]